MRLLKNIGKPEIRYRYKLVLECCIIASLLILILAFIYFPHIEKRGIEFEVPQELFTVEDIQLNIQLNTLSLPLANREVNQLKFRL